MGNRYWRNREGPHFTEKDIVLHQLKKRWRRTRRTCLQATRNSTKTCDGRGAARFSRRGASAKKEASPEVRREGVQICQNAVGQAQTRWQWSHEARQAAVAKSLKLKRSMSFSNKKKKVAPQKKGMKGSLVAGTHGVTSASGAKRRR